jgi:hypothetical protein
MEVSSRLPLNPLQHTINHGTETKRPLPEQGSQRCASHSTMHMRPE